VLGTNSPTEDFCIKYILNHTVGSHIAGDVNEDGRFSCAECGEIEEDCICELLEDD